MINKVVTSVSQAVADIKDGSTILIGGFGQAGTPFNLIDALLEQGTSRLTVVSNSISQVAALVENGRVAKLISSFPVWVDRTRPNPLNSLLPAGKIALEVVPQGTLAERIRAGGAGIPAFYVRTGVGTVLEAGKQKWGRECLLELAIKADVALIKAFKGDRIGNLIYRMTARNYNPIMAMAADLTIAEVEETVDIGLLDPEVIVTPSIFVDRLVKAPRKAEWTLRKGRN